MLKKEKYVPYFYDCIEHLPDPGEPVLAFSDEFQVFRISTFCPYTGWKEYPAKDDNYFMNDRFKHISHWMDLPFELNPDEIDEDN